MNPNYASAYQAFALFLAAMGEMEEARIRIQKAREIDPESLPIRTAEGFILYLGKNFDEATRVFTEILDRSPGFPLAPFHLGMVFS